MAEFCKDCAPKYGLQADSLPLLCEGCGKYFEKPSWLLFFKKLFGFIK